MKSAIIYYSQTGNTEKIAKAIHTGMTQITGDCDFIKLGDANPLRLYEYDLIGIGSPVFHFVEPPNVKAFISNMRSVGGKHAFVFCTHCTHWFFEQSIIPRLKRRGLVIIGSADWYGCGNGPLMTPSPYFTDGHPDEIDLNEAEAFGKEMVIRSQKIYAGDMSLIPPDPEQKPYPEWHKEDFTEILNWPKMVKLNMEKCLYPACRLCVDNCPMKGIDLSVKPPIFASPCTSCHFCGQICPTGAIEIDTSRIQAASDLLSLRIREVFLDNLKSNEEKGHFRPHVRFEDVGYDTPLWKIYNGNPKWIIGKGRP